MYIYILQIRAMKNMNLNLKIQAPWRPGALCLSTPGYPRFGISHKETLARELYHLPHSHEAYYLTVDIQRPN
jgi:hypothetical protein